MPVRPFVPADAPAWVALHNAVWRRTATAASLLAEDAARPAGQVSRRWVAEESGQVVGFGHLHFFPFLPPNFLQLDLAVSPDFRGRGHGAGLWETALAAAQAAGTASLATNVRDDDPPGRAWAERRGFTLHAHRFASRLDLTTFDETPFLPALARAGAQGVTFSDLAGADEATVTRYLDFVADRLTETPDLAGHPRWARGQVREILHLDKDPRPDWLVLALGAGGEWLGTTAMVQYRDLAYNELTAVSPQARGRGLALPLKLCAIRRARAAGLSAMATNNHSANAPMLVVNRRLGFAAQVGKWELFRESGPLAGSVADQPNLLK